MTLHDVRRLNDHWKKNPPLRALVMAIAKALGVEITLATDKPKYMTAAEAKRMLEQTGGRLQGMGPRR